MLVRKPASLHSLSTKTVRPEVDVKWRQKREEIHNAMVIEHEAKRELFRIKNYVFHCRYRRDKFTRSRHSTIVGQSHNYTVVYRLVSTEHHCCNQLSHSMSVPIVLHSPLLMPSIIFSHFLLILFSPSIVPSRTLVIIKLVLFRNSLIEIFFLSRPIFQRTA